MMIDPRQFLRALEESQIGFVTGVPDSLLKDVCACIAMGVPPERHVIATNEGSAVAMAIGHYLSRSRPALVYMQNSGLGNSVNPIASLADREVYAIPMILMIGWRAEIQSDGTQLHDEPQHVKQGRITLGQLELLDIPYRIIDRNSDIRSVVKELADLSIARSSPVALIVRKGTFQTFKMDNFSGVQESLSREEAIAIVLSQLPADLPIVSTTGMASRELFEIRAGAGTGHQRDFLTVGGMGHASQIATGIALDRPDIKVVCLDGDGAVLMHTGGLAISAERRNLFHIVLNNGAHDSVGGQPTKGSVLDLTSLAKKFGYKTVSRARTKVEIEREVPLMLKSEGSAFLEISCRRGARADLGRPTRSPLQNKSDFMTFVQNL